VTEIGLSPSGARGIAAVAPTGAFRTTDQETWTWIPALADVEVFDVAFGSGDPETAYLATGRGLLVSRDGGDSWSRLGRGSLPEGAIRAVAVAPTGTLFAGTAGESLWRSDDRGKTWRRIFNGIAMPCPREIVVAPWNPDLVYVLSAHCSDVVGAERTGILVSSDGGARWEVERSTAFTTSDKSTSQVQALTAMIGAEALWVGLTNPAQLWRTDWPKALNAQLSHLDHPIEDLAVTPSLPDAVFLTSGDGVWRFDSGPRELRRIGELPGSGPLAIAPGTPRSILVGGRGGKILRSQDLGASWREHVLDCPQADQPP